MDKPQEQAQEQTKEQTRKEIFEFLKSHGVMTLATSEDNQPWVCTVYYGMDDDMNFYVVTDPNSRHGKQIENNQKIAFNIFHSHQLIAELKQGLQGIGKIEVVDGIINVTKGLMLWHKTNPGIETKITVTDILKKISNTSVYKITPSFIKYVNQELYGDKEYSTLEL